MIVLINIVSLALAILFQSDWIMYFAIATTLFISAMNFGYFFWHLPRYLEVASLVHTYPEQLKKSGDFDKLVISIHNEGFTTEGDNPGLSLLVCVSITALYAFSNHATMTYVSAVGFLMMVLIVNMHLRTWTLLRQFKQQYL